MLQHLHVSDYISILKELGRECLGAIQIVDEVQNGLLEELKKSAGELKEKGFAQADEIAGKIAKGFKCRGTSLRETIVKNKSIFFSLNQKP